MNTNFEQSTVDFIQQTSQLVFVRPGLTNARAKVADKLPNQIPIFYLGRVDPQGQRVPVRIPGPQRNLFSRIPFLIVGLDANQGYLKIDPVRLARILSCTTQVELQQCVNDGIANQMIAVPTQAPVANPPAAPAVNPGAARNATPQQTVVKKRSATPIIKQEDRGTPTPGPSNRR